MVRALARGDSVQENSPLNTLKTVIRPPVMGGLFLYCRFIDKNPMQNFQIKDRLAKLLAGENIIVEHRQVSTASFDVEQRILTLPMWVMDSNSAYDMLIGHEVGHALYTPVFELDQFITNRGNYKEGKYKNVEFSHMNIIEDIRIEKMLQKKFPGFRKTFKKGYADLNNMDFFSLKNRDVDNMSFMDRMNLYFKLGSEIIIKFTDEEMDFIENIKNNVDTFDDVLDYCLLVKEFNSNKINSNNTNGETPANSPENNNSNDTPESNSDDTESQGDQYEPESNQKFDKETVKSDDTDSNDYSMDSEDSNSDVTTQESFDNKLKELIDTQTYERRYVTIPEVKLESIVVGSEIIESECKPFQDKWISFGLYEKYSKFKKESQSSVNYMIKEFQTKKSADEYARSHSSRTGVLDPKQLHSYKFSENIFKQIQVVKQGQNHGMIFVLDWSGSMQECILETTKQLLQLVWFCKKQNIPFDVYCFTNSWDKYWTNHDYNKFEQSKDKVQTVKHNDIQVDPHFNMLNLISSSRSSKDFETDCRNLFIISYLSAKNYGYNYPMSLQMSSTPLNSAIITLRKIIPEFYKTTKIDCLSTIILTDGESDSLTHYASFQKSPMRKYNPDNEEFYESVVYRCIIRDLELGCVYPEITERSYYSSLDKGTECLLTNLKDKFPDMNLIGIRIVPSKETQRFLSGYADDYKSRATWTKDRNICLNDTPYDILYGMSTTILNKDTSIDLPSDASLSKINTAIKKSLKAKNANRKMLSSFVETIA